MIKECCACGKRERDGLWSREFFPEVRDRVSHGYCPACFEEFMDSLDQLLLTGGARKLTVTVGATVER